VPYGRVNQRSRAFALTLGLGPPKEAKINRLSGAGVSAGVLFSTLGVARCGRSVGCVLCALWAVPAAVLGGGGGGRGGGGGGGGGGTLWG